MSQSTGILETLARHNGWANRQIFGACSGVDEALLAQSGESYDSVIGILDHLVQVEHVFLEFAHGRSPERGTGAPLGELAAECADLDKAYIDYARELDADPADSHFRVPWFDFDISLIEGVLQPLTHSHKHRADVSMLLPSLGGMGIEMDLVQWLDEEGRASGGE